MLKQIFSIKVQGLYYIIKICGLKLHIKSLKLAYKKIKELEKKQITSRSSEFFWANEEKFTTQDKIWYLSQKFYEQTGYFPNFKNPKSLNEKLNWLKLNYYNPIENICIDKYEFKKYIKNKLGDGYTIPLLGVYDDVNDINFDKLPQKFVIKITTSGSGEGVEIVKDKNKIDVDKLKYKFNNLQQEWNSIYYYCLSRGYKNIKPRIIIEEYMPIREGDAIEYKMFCFHGEMKFCLIEKGYFSQNPKRAIYNKNFELMPFKINFIPVQTLNIKPEKYKLMIKIAETLAKDFPFVRVDFYLIANTIYVGEMTFTSGGGFSIFQPEEWDYKIGEWLDLTKLNSEYLHILPEFQIKS